MSKILFSLAVLGVFSVFALLPFYEVPRWGMADIFLRLKPSIPIHPRLTVVEVDDPTFESLRIYPLTRDLVARGINKLAELGAEVVLVDSEYLEPSPRVVSETYLKEYLPEFFRSTVTEIEGSSTELFRGLQGQSNTTSPSYARELIREWPEYLDSVRENLTASAENVALDNDILLGDALRFHGRAHVTITPTVESFAELSDEQMETIRKRIALKKLIIADQDHLIRSYDKVGVAIAPVLSGANGAGNVEQTIDADGVRRRIDLLFQFNGMFFPHISLSALLDWVGNPEIILYRDRVVLKQARHPEGGVQDMEIPLDESGRMIIHWPAGRFDETFRRVSFLKLLRDEEMLERILYNFQVMERLEWMSLYKGEKTPQGLWGDAEAMRLQVLETGDHSLIREYRNIRLRFVEAARAFVTGTALNELTAYFESLLTQEGLAQDQKVLLEENLAYAKEVFPETLETITLWDENRKEVEQAILGNWISLGYTGRSTTDIGVNPFDPEYMNVGTMASVVNTVLQGRYLDDRPWYWSLIFMIPVVAFLPSLTRRLNPLQGLLIGLGSLLFVMGVYFAVFAFLGIYLDAFFAFGVTLTSWVISYVISFLQSNKEKAFIKDAFGQYVSYPVIQQLIADPSYMKLGGEKKNMTAIFTDVKGFSSISEQLTAEELVELLNEYLTIMSNIIMDEKGTIDKYEGDAIIAFFNAPVPVEDHAIRACRSALLMKKAEERANPDWLERGKSPSALFTRIGINTGEMVVGNMGTTKKKNYTIMGNHVNLAARLEGVNKQYGTSILISENTFEMLGDQFLCRKLDKVRVVGVTKPLRLLELVEFSSEASEETRMKIDGFHQCLEFFEARDYKTAEEKLKKLLVKYPEDGPSQTFLKRSQEYLAKPPPNDWDGVWNLTSK